jgi:hypothetical protein
MAVAFFAAAAIIVNCEILNSVIDIDLSLFLILFDFFFDSLLLQIVIIEGSCDIKWLGDEHDHECLYPHSAENMLPL